MAESVSHHHHGHHHKHEDYASRFKRRSLLSITIRRKADRWLKRILFVVAVVMVLFVVYAYYFA